jgi:acyl-CoA thioesterase
LESLRRDRFAAHSGVELIEVRPGYARTRLAVGPHHFNSVDLVHGGALFTLAAVALFAACNASGKQAVGINLNLSCLHPSRGGPLVAEAQEVARSRRLATCTVRVTDEQGQLIATLQGTAYVKDTPFPPA